MSISDPEDATDPVDGSPDEADDGDVDHKPSSDLISEDDPLIGHVKPDVVPVEKAGIANDYNLDLDDGVTTDR